jgi:amino acid transporter
MNGTTDSAANESAHLVRGIGPWQATALNVTMVVGAGVFGTIPVMLKELPGPYALLGWLVAGALIFVDGLIWSELGAALPGSGGSYKYLLECYGKNRWGRLMAFLFIWQFLISGPLELGSGLVFIAQFSTKLSPAFERFNHDWIHWEWEYWPDEKVSVAFGPARLLGFSVGLAIIGLLWRNITSLGRLTVTFWIGVLATIFWILVEGLFRFDADTAFAFTGAAQSVPKDFGWKLGAAMSLAMYSYLGYYNVCYIGDEVRDPGRTIPRSILWTVLIVCLLFIGIHLALLGTVPWEKARDAKNLSAEFMEQIHGPWAATLVTVLLIWCIIGSAFAGLLGYSRIPYGAARQGHFFTLFGHVHPEHRIPHVSLLLVGGMTLFWSFFDVESIISALIVTRILEQFVAQILGVMLLRRYRPDLPRPYKIWLYPLPCFLALAGWTYMYVSAKWIFMALGVATLVSGIIAFFIWSWHTGGWPFEAKPAAAGNDVLEPSPDGKREP